MFPVATPISPAFDGRQREQESSCSRSGIELYGEGHGGWEEYAPFYDWENARTLGRGDVPFSRTLALQQEGPVLELGCGTGRISMPLAKAGVSLVGIDRSEGDAGWRA